jgi:hypothetical protein
MYTLLASTERDQMSRAQFRAKSAVRAVFNGERKGKESSLPALSGNAQTNAAGASDENWFCEKEAGAAETGCDSGMEWLAAQQLAFLPQWQQERAALITPASGGCARTMFVHASTRLQTMASAVFMV